MTVQTSGVTVAKDKRIINAYGKIDTVTVEVPQFDEASRKLRRRAHGIQNVRSKGIKALQVQADFAKGMTTDKGLRKIKKRTDILATAEQAAEVGLRARAMRARTLAAAMG